MKMRNILFLICCVLHGGGNASQEHVVIAKDNLLMSRYDLMSRYNVKDILFFGAAVGATATVAWYALTKLANYYFSAQAYYNSAKKIHDTASIEGIEKIQSFEDIVLVLRNNHVYQWRRYVYSDCYVVDVYHFIQKQLCQLSLAQEYLMFARTKKDCHAALLDGIGLVELSIDNLYDHYMHMRSICERHPLFNRHMAIYQERERITYERQETSS